MAKSVKGLKRIVALLTALLMLFNISVVVSAETSNLSAKMYWSADMTAGIWMDVESADAGAVFNLTGFEPGSEAVRYLKVENNGKRALSYAIAFASETEAGELASIIDVYCKNGVSANTTIAEMTNIGTLADVIGGNAISTGNILPANLTDEGFYSGNAVIAVALKMKEDASTEYMNKDVADFSIKLTATECAYENYPSVDKFALKFPNTSEYIYRVGNANAIKLGSLFKALDGADIGNVTVSIEPIDSDSDVTSTYTANANWTQSTIKFEGTGSVKVTIDDDDYANALSINLDVINATNLTSAANVTSGDAVLLNDITISTITIKNGYTLYGNGFKIHAPNDIPYSDWGEAFVYLEDGTVDNAQIICPHFSHQVLYQSNMREPANKKEGDFYYNVRSAVKMEGNSKIANSYVAGGRAAVFATSGYPVIDNSTIYGGAAANIHVFTVHNLLLKDTTLIQEPIQANVNDTSKTLMGVSVFLVGDENGNSSPVTLEGELVQYAWAHEGYKSYVPSQAQSFIGLVLAQNDFKHSITYKDGTTAYSVNLGFLNLPDSGGAQNPAITDNRSNKDSVPYSNVGFTAASVYSYKNSNGTNSAFATYPAAYVAGESANVPAKLAYTGDTTATNFKTEYSGADGWNSTFTVDLDNISSGSYTFSFDNLIAKKYGRNLNYIVKDTSGNIVDKNVAITLSDSATLNYVVEITDNLYYGADGLIISGREEIYSYPIKIVATKTSILPPVNNTTTWENPLLVVKSKDSDWSAAVPVSLSTININYYSTAAKAYKDINLGEVITLSSTGKQNETNNYWQYTGEDFTFKATCGYIHEGKSVYGMPVVVNNGGNKMYFVIASTNGYVSTGTSARTVTVTYEFTDGNNNKITFTQTCNAVYNNLKGTQYSYDDFIKGTLKEASGGGLDDWLGCLTAGTEITLSDGTTKKIEEVTYEDELLVWNFIDGEPATVPAALIINDGDKEYTTIKLMFDDSSDIKLVDVHGLYDEDLNKFVYIDPENVESYVGHSFVKTVIDENGIVSNKSVKLVDYEVKTEYTGCYTIQSALNVNCIADGFLTQTPPLVDGYFDYFEMGEGMRYDTEKMQADIEKYGLYTYEDFEKYLSYDAFIALNGPYLKVAVGKGYFDFDFLVEQIGVFGVGNTAAIALADDTEPTITITAGGNSITTADYAITVTKTEGGYTLTATGTATTGYAKVTIDGDTYYTVQIPQGESIAINLANVKNAKDTAMTAEAFWGNSANYGVVQEGLLAGNSTIDFGTFGIKAIEGASVTFENTTKYDVTGDVYLAVYVNNMLEDVKTAMNATIRGKDTFTFAPTDLVAPQGSVVKAFLWKVGTMIPILK